MVMQSSSISGTTRLGEHDDEVGGVSVEPLDDRRVLVIARGHWHEQHREALAKGLNAAIRRSSGPVSVFWDFSQMVRYEPAVRKGVTQFLSDHREELDKHHRVLAPDSGLVAMGISAASVALSLVGVRVEMTRDSAMFQRWLAGG